MLALEAAETMPETPVFPHLVHLNLGRPVAFLAWKGLERYRFDDCGFNKPPKKVATLWYFNISMENHH